MAGRPFRQKIRLGQKYKALVRKWPHLVKDLNESAADGLQDELFMVANEVREDILSGQHGIQTRTGNLQRAVTSYPDDINRLIGYVRIGDNQSVNKYAWLLSDETKTIRPKKRLLAIPAGANKTADAGVGGNLFASPLDQPEGFWIKPDDSAVPLFGDTVTGQFRLLFVGLPQVTIEGRGILRRVVRASAGKISTRITNYMRATIRKHRLGRR